LAIVVTHPVELVEPRRAAGLLVAGDSRRNEVLCERSSELAAARLKQRGRRSGPLLTGRSALA
jgi:hypothetical protein